MKRIGVILKSNQWKETANFLIEHIGLTVLFKKNDLICLEVGDGYIMLEPTETASNSTIIRVHPDNFELTANSLKSKGLEFEVGSFEWGKIFDLILPDGNKLQFKDDESYLQQVSKVGDAGQFNNT